MSLREGKLKAEADSQKGRQRVRLNMYCFKNITITKCTILYCIDTVGPISGLGGIIFVVDKNKVFSGLGI